jgi:serine/threonine-protein kinase ULK/ATG1
MAELQGDFTAAENGYETALWQLQTLLDDAMYDGGSIRDDDRIGIEKRKCGVMARIVDCLLIMYSRRAD